jgi:hypothetical protein
MTQMVESGVTPPKARATARVAPTISGGLIGVFVYGRGIPEPRPGDDEGSGRPGRGLSQLGPPSRAHPDSLNLTPIGGPLRLPWSLSPRLWGCPHTLLFLSRRPRRASKQVQYKQKL